MKLQLPKGMRDFDPEDKILRDSIISSLKDVFELYGYIPLETPILERYDILSAKFAAGEESDSLKETFKLKDQGNRKLGLRFDLTVPLSRYIAMNPNIKLPFKRYQIGPSFRDGPIKLGRYRQFDQCDVDVVGTKNMLADAELIELALAFFKKLNLNVKISINNRKLLEGVLSNFKVEKKDLESVIIVIDKLDKIGTTGIKKELKKIKLNNKIISKIIEFLTLKNDFEKISSFLDDIKNNLAKEGWKELKELYKYLDSNSKKNIILDISLARGFSYYTGTVFEGYLSKNKITSSICGGGRYDKMIGKYIGRGEYPAVGISFGVDVIFEAMKNIQKKLKTKTSVFITPIKTLKESSRIASFLRKNGINTDIDLSNRSISKNLNYINKLEIPISVIVGERDIKKKEVTLRDMRSGKQKNVKISSLIKEIKSMLSST